VGGDAGRGGAKGRSQGRPRNQSAAALGSCRLLSDSEAVEAREVLAVSSRSAGAPAPLLWGRSSSRTRTGRRARPRLALQCASVGTLF
jgi:hypothetical protein